MRTILALSAILLCGCAPERINPGADRVFQVADGIWLAQEYRSGNGQRIDPDAMRGLFATDTGRITIRANMHRRLQMAVSIHEMGEALEYEFGPQVWRVINRYSSPDFPCGEDGLHGYHPQAK